MADPTPSNHVLCDAANHLNSARELFASLQRCMCARHGPIQGVDGRVVAGLARCDGVVGSAHVCQQLLVADATGRVWLELAAAVQARWRVLRHPTGHGISTGVMERYTSGGRTPKDTHLMGRP